MEMQFLTPCFLGGADPERQGEFRLGALKNLLRYWWRQFQDQGDTENLFGRESMIFGSTKNRSPFSLYELDRSRLRFDSSGNAYSAPGGSGRSYLFYSCIGRGRAQPGRTKWLAEGSKVSFVMHFSGAEDWQIKETLLSLWLLQTFGGLGSRSRRGAGSFQIKVTDSPENMKESVLKIFESTAEDLVRAIQHGRGDDWSSLIHTSSPIYKGLATVGHFRRFPQMGSKLSADNVLDELGNKMRDDFRSCFTYNTHDPSPLHRVAAALHSAGKSGTKYTGPDPIEKTAFGLPIICNFRRRDSSGRPVGFERDWTIILEPAHRDHERRASPLFISVKKNQINDQYYANLLILWEEFLPKGEKIAVVKRDRGGTTTSLGAINQPTSKPLEDFLGSLP
jgi:CRISPR-associated protein Cmr1